MPQIQENTAAAAYLQAQMRWSQISKLIFIKSNYNTSKIYPHVIYGIEISCADKLHVLEY